MRAWRKLKIHKKCLRGRLPNGRGAQTRYWCSKCEPIEGGKWDWEGAGAWLRNAVIEIHAARLRVSFRLFRWRRRKSSNKSMLSGVPLEEGGGWGANHKNVHVRGTCEFTGYCRQGRFANLYCESSTRNMDLWNIIRKLNGNRTSIWYIYIRYLSGDSFNLISEGIHMLILLWSKETVVQINNNQNISSGKYLILYFLLQPVSKYCTWSCKSFLIRGRKENIIYFVITNRELVFVVGKAEGCCSNLPSVLFLFWLALGSSVHPPYLALFCLWLASAVRVIRGFMSYMVGNEMKCCKSLNCRDSVAFALGLDFCQCGSVWPGCVCIFHCFLWNCFGLVAVN